VVTYVVRSTVRFEVYDQFVQWLESEHIPEMLTVPGFLEAHLCTRKGGSMESSSKETMVSYKVESEDSIKKYMTEYAMKIREKGIEKFPGQFSVQREVWLETRNFTAK
jgi:antibiotic biosynthesis monooxygenase (ABM) superfamily enzyme